MTLRDVHDRCVTCGRTPSEECCEECHVAASLLEEQYRLARRESSRKANLARWGKHREVNTEAVNQ